MRKTAVGSLLGALILALTGLTSTGGSRAAADPEPDYWILAGDQSGPRLIALDPAVTDWNTAAAVKWQWQPTAALGFSAAEIAAFGRVTGFALRDTPAGQRIVVTASYGLAAVISYPAGVRQWATILPTSANLHGIELLPNGNVAVSSTNTTSGFVRVYAASQGPNATTYAEYSLHAQSHNVLWDPVTERLWLIGKQGPDEDDPRILTALAVTGTDDHPRLTEDATKWNELPDIGGHDLTADPNDPHRLVLSTDAHTYEFDKSAGGGFTELPVTAGGLAKVKSIVRQPSGRTVLTRPDHDKSPQGDCATVNTWCTESVELFGPAATRTRDGAQFYRARTMNPSYSAIGDTVHGPVSERVLPDCGTWQPPATVDTHSGVASTATAAAPDGTLHLFTLVPGEGVFDRTRSALGAWAPSATLIDSNPAVTAISASVLADGAVHVQTVVPGSGVWDRTLPSGGSWQSAVKIDGNGLVTDVSASALGSTLHVQTLVPGAGVWDRTRAGGSWSSATKIADGCAGPGANDPCVDAISSAALENGTLHVQALTPGSGVSDIARSASGSWSTSATLIDANDGITRIAASALDDGTLHVQTVVPGYGLWDRTCTSTATTPPVVSCSSAAKLDADESVFDVASAGMPNGDLRVLHASFTG
ncbi:DUF6528 family protein [Nocardioides sp. YIM 152315]|uniref:DUF6528 family protein n=1 Tax=Nocardioides sp. YIM 152315 TaxID=3031760 RepID=UPI0023DAA5CA|nr:DUF6528 family protein [Nocardioides sp. YIM 152315]MDF1602622.1 DUF6528 family protein [Nocardioides sp. YIM 152315]